MFKYQNRIVVKNHKSYLSGTYFKKSPKATYNLVLILK